MITHFIVKHLSSLQNKEKPVRSDKRREVCQQDQQQQKLSDICLNKQRVMEKKVKDT